MAGKCDEFFALLGERTRKWSEMRELEPPYGLKAVVVDGDSVRDMLDTEGGRMAKAWLAALFALLPDDVFVVDFGQMVGLGSHPGVVPFIHVGGGSLQDRTAIIFGSRYWERVPAAEAIPVLHLGIHWREDVPR